MYLQIVTVNIPVCNIDTHTYQKQLVMTSSKDYGEYQMSGFVRMNDYPAKIGGYIEFLQIFVTLKDICLEVNFVYLW